MLCCSMNSTRAPRCTWVSSPLCTRTLTSRTPPELKWLLVERATLVGDMARMERRRELLDADIVRLHRTIQALDTSMHLLESRLQPGAAGIKFRHMPEYRRRGGLKDFILEAVSQAEAGLSTREVGRRAAAQFALEFVSLSEFSVFLKNTVRPGLRDLQLAGKLECTPPGKGGKSLWQPKRALPTLAELALLAGAEPACRSWGATDDNPDET